MLELIGPRYADPATATFPEQLADAIANHGLFVGPAVPNAPGLGVDLDEAAVERFRLPEMPAKPYPHPNLLIAIRFGSGSTSYYTHTMQFWDDFLAGRLPVFQPGTRLEVVADDGSREWKDLQARAAAGAVHSGGREL